MIFLLNCQKILHFFVQNTDLIYLENCQFHSGLLVKLFKTAIFFKNRNLRIFDFFTFFFFEYLENRSRYLYISKSSEFVMV